MNVSAWLQATNEFRQVMVFFSYIYTIKKINIDSVDNMCNFCRLKETFRFEWKSRNNQKIYFYFELTCRLLKTEILLRRQTNAKRFSKWR